MYGIEMQMKDLNRVDLIDVNDENTMFYALTKHGKYILAHLTDIDMRNLLKLDQFDSITT